jgi:hypothetical protein
MKLYQLFLFLRLEAGFVLADRVRLGDSELSVNGAPANHESTIALGRRRADTAELNELLLWVVDSDAKLVRSYQKLAHICGH